MSEMLRFYTREAVDQLRRQDHGTWEDFYNAVWDPLCRFIGAKLAKSPHSQEDIEDIARQTISEAYATISRFRGDCRIDTWIKRIAWHLTVDFVRRSITVRKNIDGHSASLQLIRDISSPRSLDLERRYLEVDSLETMWRVIEEVLPSMLSVLIRMHYVEGLTAQQIADRLGGVAVGTVSSRITRALQRLREHRDRFL